MRPGESAEEALARRQRESERVEERVVTVGTKGELEAELAKVGGGGARRGGGS